MPTNARGPQSGSLSNLIVFGMPIALALLLVPALIMLVPTQQVQPSAQPVSAPTAVQAAPAEVHLTVKEWSFQPATLQLPVGKPVTLVLDNKGQLDHDVTVPSLGVNLKAAAGK